MDAGYSRAADVSCQHAKNEKALDTSYCGWSSYFIYTKLAGNKGSQISFDGDQVIITKGDNRFIATAQSDYQADLRIYGLQDHEHNKGWNPFACATHLVMATPIEYTDEASACESDAASKASMLNIIAQGSELKDKIEKIKQIEGRRCARVAGKKLYIEEFIYKDEDQTSSLVKQGNMDLRSVILLSDIQEISCK